MRIALVIALALAACGTESDEERLDDLISKAEIECGGGDYGCFRQPAADRVAACMNDALTSGARAYFKDTRQGTDGYYIYTYTFAVDHQIVQYELHDGSNFSEEAFVEGKKSCTGTFRVGETCARGGSELEACP